jgi:predicted aspartyl protease
MIRTGWLPARRHWFLALTLIFVIRSSAQSPDEALKQAQIKMAARDWDGAWDLLHQAAERNPDDPELFGSLGTVDYLRGEIADAEMEFKKAVRLNDHFARGWVGLGRVFEAGSLRAKAKICYQKAWHEDPSDIEVQRYYSRTLSPADRLANLEKYLASAGGRDSETDDSVHRQIEELKWTAGRKLFEMAPVDHAEIKLSWLMYDSKRIRGFALPVSINGGKTLRLMMDTGSGGILLNRKAAEAAGLRKISDMKFWGIGDEGDRTGETAFAETVRVGSLVFANCLVAVADRKNLADVDGLIGPDLFSMFLVNLDFHDMTMKLDRLPPHKSPAPDEDWQDREVAPELANYSPFWHVGHDILLPTRVNGMQPVLFLVDTGSASSLIDPGYAKQFKGFGSEELVTVKGVSGKVGKVQSSGFLTFEFCHYRQGVPGMLSVPLTKVARDSPQFIGIFGVTTLALFKVHIDYRDGLINLEYVGPK